MNNPKFIPVYGIIRCITPVLGDCCKVMVSVMSNNNIINLIVSADTYVVDNMRLEIGMDIIGFYDAGKPVILIYPPQYDAVAIVRQPMNENVVLDYFDENLVSSNNSLKLHLSSGTEIVTSNGQTYFCDPKNRILLVYYGAATRSIPAQATPSKVIVMCN